MNCPFCGADNPNDAIYCEECGRNMYQNTAASIKFGIKCPYCGADNPDDAKFCETCGKNLENGAKSLTEEKPSEKRKSNMPKAIIAMISAAAIFAIIILISLNSGSSNGIESQPSNMITQDKATESQHYAKENAENNSPGTDKAESKTESVLKSETEAGSNSENETSAKNVADGKYQILDAANFNEGLAFIEFEDTESEKEYIGFIDTKGVLQYYFDRNNTYDNMEANLFIFAGMGVAAIYQAEFEDGYAYIVRGDNMFLLDREGNCLASYPADQVAQFGDGFFMLKNHVSSFDENKYIYSVVDKDGNEIDRFETEEPLDNNSHLYCGGGLFAYKYDSYAYEEYVSRLVYADSGHVEEDQLTSDLFDILYEDGYYIYFCGYIKDEEAGNYIYEFTYSDKEGNWKDVVLPDEYQNGDNLSVCAMKNGLALFRMGTDFYFTYNIETGEFKRYDGNYANSLGWEKSSEMDKQCYGIGSNGTIAISLEGKDGKKYVGLIDKDMNDVCEPIPVSGEFSVSDDLLTVKQESEYALYDLKGNLKTGLPNVYFTGAAGQERFSEGFAAVRNTDSEEHCYITTDGEKAFDVNYSSGKYVDITFLD